MKVSLPADKSILVLVCEDIRQEKSGRMSLMGVFPGRVLHVPSGIQGTNRKIPRLAVYIEVTGGNGKVNGTMAFISPNGDEVHSAEIPGIDLGSKRTTGIGAVVAGLELSLDGDYQINLTLNGKRTYSRSMLVSSRDELSQD